jgi:hypothetical protein
MVTTSPVHQGEHEISRKTIAQGRPDRSGEPVVTNSYVFIFTYEAAGASDARSSLRPLIWRDKVRASLGRDLRCEKDGVCLFGCLKIES